MDGIREPRVIITEAGRNWISAATNEEELFVRDHPSLTLNVITTPKEEYISSATKERKEKSELLHLTKEGGWDSDTLMNNGSIEAKVPAKTMKRLWKRK